MKKRTKNLIKTLGHDAFYAFVVFALLACVKLYCFTTEKPEPITSAEAWQH